MSSNRLLIDDRRLFIVPLSDHWVLMRFLSWLFVSFVLAYATSAFAEVTGDWRYKLTLTVDDKGTLKTGSSVRECHGHSNYDEIPYPGGATSTIGLAHGEAVVVELKEGTLFALLKSATDHDYACDMLFRLFPIPGNDDRHGGGEALPAGIHYYENLQAKRDVPFDKLPMLVTFGDINDPKTVRLVDPKNLNASFGSNVALVKAEIEMTGEPVTTGIEKYLEWLPSRREITGYLGGWPEDASGLFLNGSEFSKGLIR